MPSFSPTQGPNSRRGGGGSSKGHATTAERLQLMRGMLATEATANALSAAAHATSAAAATAALAAVGCRNAQAIDGPLGAAVAEEVCQQPRRAPRQRMRRPAGPEISVPITAITCQQGGSGGGGGAGGTVSRKAPSKVTVHPILVKAGDNLAALGREYGVSIRELQRLNGLTSDLLYEGEHLLVPASPLPKALPQLRRGMRRTFRVLLHRSNLVQPPPLCATCPPSAPPPFGTHCHSLTTERANAAGASSPSEKPKRLPVQHEELLQGISQQQQQQQQQQQHQQKTKSRNQQGQEWRVAIQQPGAGAGGGGGGGMGPMAASAAASMALTSVPGPSQPPAVSLTSTQSTVKVMQQQQQRSSRVLHSFRPPQISVLATRSGGSYSSSRTSARNSRTSSTTTRSSSGITTSSSILTRGAAEGSREMGSAVGSDGALAELPGQQGGWGSRQQQQGQQQRPGRWERCPRGFSRLCTGWLPFAGPVFDSFISSPYGPRWGRMHEGVDLAADEGTPIRCSMSGVVTFAADRNVYGKLVEIDHGHGMVSRYAHCCQLLVQQHQRVLTGEVIGLVGATGRATGPHLHLEVRHNGKAMNPLSWFNL